MTEKTLIKKIKAFSGTISEGLVVDFPDTLQINNRQEALSALEIMRYADDLTMPSTQQKSYTVTIDSLLDGLIQAYKAGAI